MKFTKRLCKDGFEGTHILDPPEIDGDLLRGHHVSCSLQLQTGETGETGETLQTRRIWRKSNQLVTRLVSEKFSCKCGLIPSKLEEVPVIKNGLAENQNLHFLEISHIFPMYFLIHHQDTVENHEGEDREQEDGEGVLRPPPGSTRQVSPGVANHRRYTSLGVSSAATRSIWQGEAGTLLRPHAARKNGRLTKSGCNLYDTSSRCSFLCDSQVSQLGWFGSSDLTAAV